MVLGVCLLDESSQQPRMDTWVPGLLSIDVQTKHGLCWGKQNTCWVWKKFDPEKSDYPSVALEMV